MEGLASGGSEGSAFTSYISRGVLIGTPGVAFLHASHHSDSILAHACSIVSQPSPACAPIMVWVKRMDKAGARYDFVKSVDVLETVDDFIARWMAQAKLDVDPWLVTLRLVPCGARKPTAEEEQAAAELDPFDTLAEAGFTDGCSLLAVVAGALDAAGPRVSLLMRCLRFPSQRRSPSWMLLSWSQG